MDWTPVNVQDSTIRVTKYEIHDGRLCAVASWWTGGYSIGYETIHQVCCSTLDIDPAMLKHVASIIQKTQLWTYISI